jgi:drug/metabolite transporter (DMT)-like permease
MIIMPANRPTIPPALLLGFGVFAGSSAVILIKACDEQPMLISSYRLLVAALLLLPLFWRDLKNYPGRYGWKELGWSAVPGVLLAFHFITWVMGVHLTPVASASLIVNLTPVAMPFFVMAFYGERINRSEVLGTLSAVVGLGILATARLNLTSADTGGVLVCIVSMLFFAAYLALGRKNGPRLPLWLYMVPLYFIAGLVCLVCALPFVNPIKAYTPTNLLLILAMALVPTIFGHTVLNYALKFFRGQVVSIANLGQILFATLLGFLVFGEVPPPVFYLAAVFILAGVVVVLWAGYRKRAVPGG